MQKASELAYEYIKDRIISGEYKPSQRLVEYKLAEEIGVSRSTIKKTVLRLEQEKLLTVEDNKGSIVNGMDFRTVMEYLEIRESLEAIIIRHAISRISDKDIATLQETLDAMKQIASNPFTTNEDLQTYSENNRKFHNVIYDAADHVITKNMILDIKNQMQKFQIRTMSVPGRSSESLKEHGDILEALRSRDAEKAEQASRVHIHGVLETALKYRMLLF